MCAAPCGPFRQKGSVPFSTTEDAKNVAVLLKRSILISLREMLHKRSSDNFQVLMRSVRSTGHNVPLGARDVLDSSPTKMAIGPSHDADPLPDVPPDKRPRHIAVIMDGNGRWA